MSHRAKDVCQTRVPDRWMAEIYYTTGADEVTVSTFTIEELEDLDEIVERGPDWNTIEKIEITLNRPTWADR
jgi:hypothetical protein